MRQVGVLAAACLIALEESPKTATLPTTPTPASWPKAWRAFPAFRSTRRAWPPTSWSSTSAAPAIAPTEISARLKRRGVLMNAINDRQMRAVTHYDVDRAACSQALETVAECLAK